MPSDALASKPSSAEKCPRLKACLLKSWQPVPTWGSTIVIFIVLGVVLLVIGGVLMALNSQIKEYSVRYDADCKKPTEADTCQVTIEVVDKMESPVYFYYGLDNFYQNHRRYIKSRHNKQLAAETDHSYTASELKSSCDPIVTNKDLDLGHILAMDNETELKPDAAAHPCGLIARSFFNDTFTMADPSGNPLTINSNDIAWSSDKGKKFKNLKDGSKTQWKDVEDEHFIVWMRTAGLPNFRKLWGRVEKDLLPGKYTIQVKNNYDVTKFDGKKHVIISTSGPFGGRNNFLAISYLVVGAVCIVIALLFGIKYAIANKYKQN